MFRLTVLLLAVHCLTNFPSTEAAISKRDVFITSMLPANWTSTGCLTDDPALRTLTGAMYTEYNNMTQESCISFCDARGFVKAGVEYYSQCFCGNNALTSSTNANNSDCSYPCTGNSSEACGGADRLNVFESSLNVTKPVTKSGIGLWASYGCYAEGNGGRALTATVDVAGNQNNMTVANCIDACQSAGYSISGVEYAAECYCGNSFSNQAAPAIDGYMQCNMACSGNATEFCGGPGRLNVYGYNNVVPNPLLASTATSESSTSTSSSTSTVVSLSSSSTVVFTQSSSTSITSQASISVSPSWYAAGCWTDSVAARSLGVDLTQNDANNMTQELCIVKCATGGYTIAGIEYSGECYCDTQIRNGGVVATDPTTCNMPCNGNKTEACGGPDRLTLFRFGIPPSTSSVSSFTSPTSSNSFSSSTSGSLSATTMGWTSLGCYNDSVAARTLGYQQSLDGNTMTVALCQNQCKAAGFTLAGVEYAGECYCDNIFENNGAPAVDGAVGCDMACHGSASEICGGSDRLNVYTYGAISRAPSSTSSISSAVSSSTGSSVAISTAVSTTSSSSLVSSSAPTSTDSSAIYSPSPASCPASNGTVWLAASGKNYLIECYVDHAAGDFGTVYTDTFALCIAACDSTSGCVAFSYVAGGLQSPCYLKSSVGAPNANTAVWGGKFVSTPSSSSVVRLSLGSSSVSNTVTTTAITTTSEISSSSVSQTSSLASTSSSLVGWVLSGCYSDSIQKRTLSVAMQVPGGASYLTQEACNAACRAAGYSIAGTEYSAECYCDNALQNGGGPASDGNLSCNMPCNGNSSEVCGGSDRLTLFTYYNGALPSSSFAVASSVTLASSSSASSISSAASGLPSGWNYDGCYVDGVDGRIMRNKQDDNAQLTIQSCVQTCIGLGYSVAGVEYSTQCFCDNYVGNGAVLASSDTECNMKCSGNSLENCGAGDRLSVYSMGDLTVHQPPTAQNTSLPGNWTYQGCISDSVDSRALPYGIFNMVENNTATNCLSLCSQYGYPAGGMEYGDECYCGDLSDVSASGAIFEPESDCNVPCPGDPTTLCGAGNRISYYTWTGDPLYVWNAPTGTDAGEYQFLIGGVVIPLVTSQGINGKVTFLEKHGTGAPNTTGAYELDVSLVDNFEAAWRPMHVQTDIFCSASLTLPDKAGRQINVGGWSDQSTFGIRFYSPDGSPGVPSVNDWQENVNEVALQDGRWYPSAMIMPNGTILVVGGEAGSNGAPVPSLELLPKVGGSLYCDWLEKTDPYNLYPFLAVLPSGGIFVAYYNEARILDQTNLQTTRSLPNIPGAVNNFDGGRTYPFEGTMVLFPQHAPYTDPLTVLICGGSTPGPQIALDNCVTIQPDVPSSNWTIERMPSRRVISCMTALPDGTYLILNGGQDGAAGFGLATDPNLNAVLYDPTKPLTQRMSIMANTTIARLYHSEAILLQDGRVLVSGSDPEDPRFPQEYRVEVFMPPYLLSNLPRPTFTINNNNTDWAYGEQITITLGTSNSGSIKASLMGAESSTHGNSMGQRSIFPTILCSGNTCTITAPPNSNVCPPGWFQLFILDGPTPSVSTYVRIGGDPAALGDWPNYSDFLPLPGV